MLVPFLLKLCEKVLVKSLSLDPIVSERTPLIKK